MRLALLAASLVACAPPPTPLASPAAITVSVVGEQGAAGAAGRDGAAGAPGAAGAFEVWAGDVDLGPLVTVLFSGAAPIYVTWEDGRFLQRDAFGAPMRSQGVFSDDPSGCTPPLFLPSDSPGRMESDTLSTFLLDAFGPRQDGLIVRAGEEGPHEMAGYVVYSPEGVRDCIPVAMGPTPGIPVTLLQRARAVGPLSLRPR